MSFLDLDEERKLGEGSARPVDFGPLVPVHRQVEAIAAEHPTATALIHGPDRISYGELNRRANRLAHTLRQRGCGPNRPVMIWLDRSISLIVCQLAVLKSGAPYLPLDPSLSSRRLERIVEEARPGLLLTDAVGRERAEGCTLTVLEADSIAEGPSASADDNPQVDVSAEHLAYVVYTSGSTGRPKGVCVAHGQLANLIAWNHRRFEHSVLSRGSLIGGVAFDAFVEEAWSFLCAGASLAIVPEDARLLPQLLRDWLVRMEVTHAEVPTPLAERLVALPWPDHTALRFLRTGGDRLKRYPAPGLPFSFVNNYGPTECTVTTTSGVVEPLDPSFPDGSAKAPGLGDVVANVQIYILDRRGCLVPEGVPGELCIGGAGVAMGYRCRPALTAEVFIPDAFGEQPGGRLYRSGDLVRRHDGRLEFLGRTDQQIKIRGFRIEPGEIEGALLSHPDVVEALVLPMVGDQHLIAYLVLADGASVDVEALRQALAEDLPEIMVPRRWVILDRMPLTVNGKVDRSALPVPEPDAARSRPPQTPTEERLGMIFQRLLKVPNPGAEDDFFDLGGHSMLVVNVLEAIAAELGHAVPLGAFFEKPTIASLAALLDAEGVAEVSPLVTLQSEGDRPPFFLVHDVGGTAWPLKELARRLGPEQPVFGFQAVGLASGEQPLTCYSAMAHRYLQAMRQTQPRGPYCLGGYSIGGVVALEMAQQLTAAGERVELVCLLDSHLSKSSGEDLAELSRPARASRDVEPMGTYRERMREVRRANIEAHASYSPRAYGGETVLLAAERAEPGVGEAQLSAWSRLTPVRRVMVPGDHRSMLQQEGVAFVAQALARELERVRSDGGQAERLAPATAEVGP